MRDERTATKNVRSRKESRKELKKTLGGGGWHPPPTPVSPRVNGPVKLFWFTYKIKDSIVLHLT